MGTFITDGAAVLPSVKADERPASGAITEWAASDANELRSALLDLRTAALGVQTGFVSPGTALVTASGSTAARALQDRFADVVNVKDYLAVGNGTADDTAAVQAAITAASRAAIESEDYAQGGGGTVFFPRGVYKITSQLSVQADGVGLIGDGSNASALKFAITNSPTTTDGIVVGDGTGIGRRFQIRDLSLYTDAVWGADMVRDFVYLDGGVWFRFTNVNMSQASRYGLRIGGTYHGIVTNLRVVKCGDSGVCIEKSSTGTPQTSTDFYHLYSGYHYKHGIRLRSSNTVHLFSPVLEYNGAGGDPANGNGIRMGDATLDLDNAVSLWGGYFESNKGWDIYTGDGATAKAVVQMFGGFATAIGGTPKTTTYGFFYGSRAAGGFQGVQLADYTSGNSYKTYSVDSSCKVDILGVPGGGLNTANGANAPTMRDLGGILDDYEGLVQWYDANDVMSLRGRYGLRVGNGGTGLAAGKLQRGAAVPSSGTWNQADFVLNYGPTSVSGRNVLGWRCLVGGTPGTWEPLYAPEFPQDSYVNISASAGANAVDVTYKVYGLQFNSNLTASVGAYNDGGTGCALDGRIFSVSIFNNSGGNLTGLTWNGVYRFANGAGPTAPTTGKRLIVTFSTDGTGAAYEISRSVEVS